jgi:enoyl-CoA hydratase/carnithine racemase
LRLAFHAQTRRFNGYQKVSFLSRLGERRFAVQILGRQDHVAKIRDPLRLTQLKSHLGARRASSERIAAVIAEGSSSEQATNSSILSAISEIAGHEGKVGVVTVSNARKLNVVNSELLLQLREALLALASTPALRVVVLTGATLPEKSPAFIGGANINEMTSINSPDEARDFITKIHKVCQAIRDLQVPVIARIHGFALGAGLEIMAACDLRVATKSSIFGMPEVKVGIPSVIEARLLPDLIGWGRTRKLLYLAENINADVAMNWGLVEEVCTGVDELDQTVEDWVNRIAQNGTEAMRSQKKLIRSWESCGVKEGIEQGIESFADSWKDGGIEPKAMMGKFLTRKR